MDEVGQLEDRERALGSWSPARPSDDVWASICARATSRRRRRRAGVSVVVVGAFVAAAVVLVAPADDSAEVVTTPPVVEPAPFRDLAPGWHDLDTGPVPASVFPSVVWTGSELIVGDGLRGLYAFDPADERWRTLAPLPFETEASLAWIGDRLVAVVDDMDQPTPDSVTWSWNDRSAVWDPETDTWRELGAVPVAPEYAAVGSRGPFTSSGHALVWTGERLVDITNGAVLDPEAMTWSALPLPADLVPYTRLLYSKPQWDGREIVLAAIEGPGLAWNATVTAYREIPALAPELSGDGQVVPDHSVVGARDRVAIITATGAGLAMELDSRTDTWSALPPVPGMAADAGCVQPLAAAVGGTLVVQPCDGRAPVFLDRDTWRSTGEVGTEICCMTQWVSLGDVLLSWSTDTDTQNNPDAPYVRAKLWVPPN